MGKHILLKKKNVAIATLFFIFFALLVTYPLILRIHTGIYGPFYGTDLRGTLWFPWWFKYAYLNKLDAFQCPFMNAPFGLDFSQFLIFPIPFTVTRCLTIFSSPAFALNFLSIISLAASGLIVFLLSFYLSSCFSASLIAGFIFAFSPYHLNKLAEFSYIYIGTFAALYFLFLLKLKEKMTFKNIVFTAVAFTLLLAFSTYYAYFSIILTFGFLIFCFFYQWRMKLGLLKSKSLMIKNRVEDGVSFLGALAAVFLLVFLFNAPILIKVIKNMVLAHGNTSLGESLNYVRSFDYLFAQSARPLSYLLPASTHPVFGNFTEKLFGSFLYGRGSVEQTLYLGWIPLALSFWAFLTWKQKRRIPETSREYIDSEENFLIGFFLFSAIFMFFCSLPPIVDLGIFKIYFPSYYLYQIFPMFRAYARCGVLVMFCISILAGFGTKFLLEKFSRRSKRIAFVVLILVGIAFEFTNIPPWRVTDTTANIPEIYKWLSRQKGDFIIAEYPMPKAVAGEAAENYDYMFYQTIHEKKMVNGASPGTKSFKIREEITRLDSPVTASILKGLGVKYVIVHLKHYRSGEYKEAAEVVGALPRVDETTGYRILRSFGDDLVYEIIASPADISILPSKV